MLAPSAEPSTLSPERTGPTTMLRMPTGDESLTEEYGEQSSGTRTSGGDVDFFSGMGTERRRKGPKETLEVSTISLFPSH